MAVAIRGARSIFGGLFGQLRAHILDRQRLVARPIVIVGFHAACNR